MILEMVNRVCVLIEILSILLCIHKLYGEKFKLDTVTICFLVVEMILMTAIEVFELTGTISMLIYPMIAVYFGVKFGFNLRAIIINNFLYLAIIGSLQIILTFIGHYGFGINYFYDWIWLVFNVSNILIILFLPGKVFKAISTYLQDKEKILIISLVVCTVVAIYCIVDYKSIRWVEVRTTVLLFICILLIIFLIVQLNRYKVKAKEIETELKMQTLYEDSFQNLIQDIRLRQHEFDNHISTIFSQHYSCHTYKELVEVQKNYCEDLLEENHYNKLLSKGNSILIGFLYGKFLEIDKRNIEITYKVSISESKLGIPIYKIVEILGDLINNAAEALDIVDGKKKLYVAIVGNENVFEIEVCNISQYISLEEIHNFFAKDYSKKGRNRGLGLYNVKRICEEYELKIECSNKMLEDENWISFVIRNS